jgi:hypothetical protein
MTDIGQTVILLVGALGGISALLAAVTKLESWLARVPAVRSPSPAPALGLAEPPDAG